MNLKDKIRTYNFWISLASAVLVFLRLLGQIVGFKIDSSSFMDIVTALCGILVVLGIIIMPTSSKASTKVETEVKNQVKEQTNSVEALQPQTEIDNKINENISLVQNDGSNLIAKNEDNFSENVRVEQQNENQNIECLVESTINSSDCVQEFKIDNLKQPQKVQTFCEETKSEVGSLVDYVVNKNLEEQPNSENTGSILGEVQNRQTSNNIIPENPNCTR